MTPGVAGLLPRQRTLSVLAQAQPVQYARPLSRASRSAAEMPGALIQAFRPQSVGTEVLLKPMPFQPMPFQPMPFQPMPFQPMPFQPMPFQPMPFQPMPF